MTKDKTAELIKRLVNSRPKKMFRHVEENNAGIGCVLRYLEESGRAVSAGEISGYMNVSTARVAVILRKMQEKQLIVKLSDPNDARKTMISLSEHGKQFFVEKKEKVLAYFSHVIECIGEERFMEFIEISEEIQAVVDTKDFADIISG